MNDCIFCKIIKNEIPSYTIYEDDLVKVFLDINPSSNGHSLIIPKKHFDNLNDINDETLFHINKVSREIYKLIKDRLNCDGLTITQNNEYGQDVKHYHMHLIPKYKDKKELIDVKEIYETLKKKD